MSQPPVVVMSLMDTYAYQPVQVWLIEHRSELTQSQISQFTTETEGYHSIPGQHGVVQPDVNATFERSAGKFPGQLDQQRVCQRAAQQQTLSVIVVMVGNLPVK